MPVKYCECLNAIDRGSMANVKSKGLRGHPCLVPRDRGKYFEHTLFVITDALGENIIT